MARVPAWSKRPIAPRSNAKPRRMRCVSDKRLALPRNLTLNGVAAFDADELWWSLQGQNDLADCAPVFELSQRSWAVLDVELASHDGANGV